MRPIASKLVFLSVFKLIETICPNILAKPLKQESKVSTFGRRAPLKSVLITLSAWNYILAVGEQLQDLRRGRIRTITTESGTSHI